MTTITQADRDVANHAFDIAFAGNTDTIDDDMAELIARHREAAMIEGARLALEVAAGWPTDARFAYGDPVSAIIKREGQPRFPGYVVGWYRPRDGRHIGYAVEHERDGIIHVYPDAALQAGFE